jgi:hypothetical protein
MALTPVAAAVVSKRRREILMVMQASLSNRDDTSRR